MYRQGEGTQEIRIRQQGFRHSFQDGNHPRSSLLWKSLRRTHDCPEFGTGLSTNGKAHQIACGRSGIPGNKAGGKNPGCDSGHSQEKRHPVPKEKETPAVLQTGRHRAYHRTS